MWPEPSQWKPRLRDAIPAELTQESQRLMAQMTESVDSQWHSLISEWMPVWVASPWAARTFISKQVEFDALGDIQTPRDYSGLMASLSSVESEQDLMRSMRRLRLQEMVRIGIRDILGVCSLEQTLGDLSRLSYAFVQLAVAWSEKTFEKKYGQPLSHSGEPQSLMVLGMGKMGGQELNFSSDIDLIFFYAESGQTTGQTSGQASNKSLDNQEYFLRLGRNVIKLLGENTDEGFVYRVDMRLRPFGKAGALALSLQAAEEYYQTQGREWERYAMIKAIPLTGKASQVQALQKTLQPFVFRRYLDFSAIQSLRELKSMIKAQVAKKSAHDDIKLGSGGIREIEFIGQAFQLIYGGKDSALQVRGIVPVLELLAERGVLNPEDVERLLSAYTFLRLSENRLQLVLDQQTHRLPKGNIEQARLAYTMGCEHWEHYLSELNRHRKHVTSVFDQVFAEQTPSEIINIWQGVWQQIIPEESILTLLSDHGFIEPEVILDEIKKFKASSLLKRASPVEQQRVANVFPVMLAAMAQQSQPDQGLKRGIQLIRNIVHRSVYLVMLSENEVLMARLCELIAKSAWIAQEVIQQPLLLDQLLDECLMQNVQLRPSLDQRLESHMQPHIQQGEQETDPFEAQLDELRRFKKAYVLNVATLDIMNKMPLMKVSDHLTAIAESCLRYAHRMAWLEMTNKYGFPHAWEQGKVQNPSLAVIGFGKLGGIEMGYGSDLDIVFVHDSHGERSYTSGVENDRGVIDNSLFFARLAQRMTSIINTRMITGMLYEVDTRLRPDGASGEMVKSLNGFERYELEKAWTWEHQALVRARFICGQASLKERLEAIRHRVLQQPRDRNQLLKDILDMREKMREHLGGKEGKISLKQDRGGLTDIEFMVQFSVLFWAHQYPELTQWTDNIRILETLSQVLKEDCHVNSQDCGILIESYRVIRARIHRLALDQKKAVIEAHEIDHNLQQAMDAVKDCWQRWMV